MCCKDEGNRDLLASLNSTGIDYQVGYKSLFTVPAEIIKLLFQPSNMHSFLSHWWIAKEAGGCHVGTVSEFGGLEIVCNRCASHLGPGLWNHPVMRAASLASAEAMSSLTHISQTTPMVSDTEPTGSPWHTSRQGVTDWLCLQDKVLHVCSCLLKSVVLFCIVS